MSENRIRAAALSLLMAAGIIFTNTSTITAQEKAAPQAAAPAESRTKPVIAKLCTNCHQPQAGSLRGNFDNVAFKSQSIQIRLDDAVEILKFNPDTVKVIDAGKPASAEALRNIKKGHEVRVEYTESGGIKAATAVTTKPPIKIAAEKLISTEEVEKLVALGPEKGKYTLVDCRPVPRVQEGSILTSVNIPYPAFDKMTDKLPKDKSALLVYYCNGVTCNMSPASSVKAEKLGYTNVKVYREGMPEWLKGHYGVLSVQFLKEAWIDKDIPHVLLDVRPGKATGQGFIKGAVSLPLGDLPANLAKFPSRDLKPPIMVYDKNGGDDAKNAAKTLIAAGYNKVIIVTGGFEAWKAAAFPVETGAPSANIAYTPKPRPGELSIEEFRKIAASAPADAMILDVRNIDEAGAGMIKGAKNVPDEDLLDRLAELPKDKMIVAHCSTGVRAEMAYHKLKEKGYQVKFLNAKIDIDKDGNYQIERP